MKPQPGQVNLMALTRAKELLVISYLLQAGQRIVIAPGSLSIRILVAEQTFGSMDLSKLRDIYKSLDFVDAKIPFSNFNFTARNFSTI